MADWLAELQELLADATPEEKAELDELLEPELSAIWLPTPGPQTLALHSAADVLLYGGAAGGGKTDLLLGAALTQHERSVIFRRAFVDLKGIEQRLFEIAGRDGWNGADHAMTRPGLLIEMGSLEKPGAEFSWQGRPHDLIGFDEGAQLSAAKVRFVMGWLRSASGRRCRVIIASNPPIGAEGEWLVTWFAPWLDPLFPHPAKPGELRFAVIAGDKDGTTVWVEGPGWYVVDPETKTARPATEDEVEAAMRGDPDAVAVQALSRTFVPALLNDNPYLRGTKYLASLMAMQEPLRTKLLKGDFMAGKEDAAYQVIPSAWVEAAMERWKAGIGRPSTPKMLALGVDVAQGGADATVLAPLYGVAWYGELKRREGIDTKNGPAVAGLVLETMRDRCQVSIDCTGGHGGSARDHLETCGVNVNPVVFSSGSSRKTRDRLFGFGNIRAQLWWGMREALDPVHGDNLALPPDTKLKAQLCAPLYRVKGSGDGSVIFIEQKDEVRKRLGCSTDEADAVIMARHRLEDAINAQRGEELRPGVGGEGTFLGQHGLAAVFGSESVGVFGG